MTYFAPSLRADYGPTPMPNDMADPNMTDGGPEEVPNDADIKYLDAVEGLMQQVVKLSNGILLEGQSDDVAAWAYESLLDATSCLAEIQQIRADLAEDKADQGADEDVESSAMKIVKKKRASRTAMGY